MANSNVSMARQVNNTVPACIGFVPRPNLVLPPYILTEVYRFRDVDGVFVRLRRPRPLSIIAGAEVVLQSDPALLARYGWFELHEKNKIKNIVISCDFAPV